MLLFPKVYFLSKKLHFWCIYDSKSGSEKLQSFVQIYFLDKKWTFQIVCLRDKISFALHCRAKKLVTSMKKGDSGKLQMLISQLEMSLETLEKQGMNK